MDINIIRGISTLFVLLAFIGITVWAYSPKRKQEFNEEAANLPFDDSNTPHSQPRIEDTIQTGDSALKKPSTGV